jgi:predicted ATPase
MITKWNLTNFKSIRLNTELELSPLTIFAGANSSGKSSVLQSMLLIAQSLSNRVESRPIVLNGVMVNLGQLDDLKSAGSGLDRISIGFTAKPVLFQSHLSDTRFRIKNRPARLSMSNAIDSINCSLEFGSEPTNGEFNILQIHPRLYSTEIATLIKHIPANETRYSVRIYPKRLAAAPSVDHYRTDSLFHHHQSELQYDIDFQNFNTEQTLLRGVHTAEMIGCELRNFLPSRLVYSIEEAREYAHFICSIFRRQDSAIGQNYFYYADTVLSETVLLHLADLMDDVISIDALKQVSQKRSRGFNRQVTDVTVADLFEYVNELTPDAKHDLSVKADDEYFVNMLAKVVAAEMHTSEQVREIRSERLPRVIDEACGYLVRLFTSSFKYLGPLRESPKAMYPTSVGLNPHDIGINGERTASVLDLYKNKTISYIPTSYFSSTTINDKQVSTTLESAVVDWLQYLGVADNVHSSDKGKLGHELKVSLPNTTGLRDLTHVGVGVSQVLPILVMCLLAKPDSTMLFEQPELHLHPRVQTLLADFFLSMAMCGKQCIVETHSEYLIDRMRFRIAAADIDKPISDLSRIFFVERNQGCSTFREVVVNEYGAISDWPEGFFDQSQTQAEEILLAAARKRNAKKDRANGR